MAETILGKVCPTPKGVYNATAKYEKLDIIQHDGNGYMVLKECTGVLPSEGEYYMLLSARGSDGAKGADGTDGAAGADGKSAYQAAVEAGYTGTETEFAALMNSIDDKQDKIIGTVGQVVGFDSMGLPKAAHWWSNPNLVRNWDFRKPVNRNGKTEYESGCGIDCWYGKGVQLEDEYLHVEGPMYQTIKADIAKQYYGKRITLSILLEDGSLYSGSNIVPSAVTDSNQWNHCCNVINGQALGFYVMANTGDMQIFRINSDTATAGIDVVAVKAEIGSEQTLAHKDSNDNWIINEPINYDLQYALCSLYSPSTGKWVGSQHSNPNLLDNWYFVNPIDQRNGYIVPAGTSYYQYGVTDAPVAGTLTAPVKVKRFYDNNAPIFEIDGTEYYSAIGSAVRGYCGGQRCIDRWKTGDATTVEIDDDGLLISRDGPVGTSIAQHFELDRIPLDTVVTYSQLLADGTLLTVTGRTPASVPSSGYTNFAMIDGSNAGALLSNRTWQISVGCYVDKTSKRPIAAKLELGYAQTLARQDANGNWVLNDHPDYLMEYLKCKYFLRVWRGKPSYNMTFGYFRRYHNAGCIIAVSINSPMRCNPVVLSWTKLDIRLKNTSYQITPDMISNITCVSGNDNIIIDLTFTSDAVTSFLDANSIEINSYPMEALITMGTELILSSEV